MIYKEPFPDQQYHKQRWGKGNALCSISSAGYPTMLIPSGLEGKKPLFSLPNVFSRTQPRHSGLTQGRFLPGVLHSYRLKRRRNHNAKRTRQCRVHLALHTSIAESSALTIRQILSPQCGAWRGFKPQIPSPHRGAGRDFKAQCWQQEQWVPGTQTAPVKLAIVSEHGEAFLFASTAVPLGFDIDTKWNYIL